MLEFVMGLPWDNIIITIACGVVAGAAMAAMNYLTNYMMHMRFARRQEEIDLKINEVIAKYDNLYAEHAKKLDEVSSENITLWTENGILKRKYEACRDEYKKVMLELNRLRKNSKLKPQSGGMSTIFDEVATLVNKETTGENETQSNPTAIEDAAIAELKQRLPLPNYDDDADLPHTY